MGGMVINYSTWRSRERVDGYVFLAADQANESFNAEAFKEFHKDVQFTVHWGSIALGKLTRGVLSGTQPAFEFHYPDSMAQSAPVDNIAVRTKVAKPLSDVLGPRLLR